MEKANWAIAWHDGEFKVLSVTLWVLRKTLISSLFTTLLIPNVSVFPTYSPDTNWMSYNSVTTLTWS